LWVGVDHSQGGMVLVDRQAFRPKFF